MTTAAKASSPSPSPPPEAPATTTSLPSHRYTAFQRLYRNALQSTLASNNYENFSCCFPTPAKYCPRALEGVHRQLNTRLEEECLRDFEKICQERNLEEGLGVWEGLVEDARRRKTDHEEKAAYEETATTMDTKKQAKAMHDLSPQELYSAHVTPMLTRAEQELQEKLDGVQQGNREVMEKIETQRGEITRLVEQLERMIEDVEGAATVVEEDTTTNDLRLGISGLNQSDGDVNMEG